MRTTPPTPIHALSGFLPALARARRRHPAVPMATWRAIARILAAPGRLSVTTADLCALAGDVAAQARLA